MDDRDIHELIQDLGSDNEKVRQKAVEKLIEVGKHAIPALIESLNDKDWHVQRMAAGALREMAEKGVDVSAVIPYLIAALNANDLHMRDDAAKILVAIREPAILPLIDCLRDRYAVVRNVAAGALVVMREPAVPALIDALKDKDYLMRPRAAEALGEIGDERAVLPLIDALKDEGSDVRTWAAGALEKILDKQIEKGNYSTALTIIKAFTLDTRKEYEGKKDRDSLKERREKLSKFESLAQEIHDKMNPDKKKFPVKHQQIRTVRKKVRTNG